MSKTQTIRPIINKVNLGFYRMDVTQSEDCFNGLIYKGKKLIACVAAGLTEGQDKLIEKAKIKIRIVDPYYLDTLSKEQLKAIEVGLGSPSQLKTQYERNAQTIGAMYHKALATGQKVNGYTAKELFEQFERYERKFKEI